MQSISSSVLVCYHFMLQESGINHLSSTLLMLPEKKELRNSLL